MIGRGTKCFTFHLLSGKGRKKSKDQHMSYWNWHWMSKNERFETTLLVNHDLKSFSECMFFVWNGNHRLQAWLLYINHLHDDEASWHNFVDSIILDTFHGLVELFIACHDKTQTSMFLTFFLFATSS